MVGDTRGDGISLPVSLSRLVLSTTTTRRNEAQKSLGFDAFDIAYSFIIRALVPYDRDEP